MTETKVNNSTEASFGSKLLYYGILLVFLFEYTRLGNYIHIINDIKANVFTPLVIFLLTLFASKQKSITDDIKDNANTILMFSLIIMLGISTLNSYNYSFSLNILSACTGFVIFYYIIKQNIRTSNKLYGVFIILILCHLFLIANNLDVITDPTARSYIKNNPFMGDGNDFSLSICIVIPLCLFLLKNADGSVKKTSYLVILIILMLTVIGTSSRGASLSLICVLLYLGIKSSNKVKFAFVALFMLSLVFVYAPPMYFKRLENVNNWQESSAQGRIKAWKAAFEMAKDHPFLGVGAGHFPEKYASDYQLGEKQVHKKTAHSMYFLALGELGFPGLFFILGFVIINFFKNEKLISQLIKNNSNEELRGSLDLVIFLNASLISFSVAGMFLSVLYYPHVFVLAGLLDSTRRIARENLLKYNSTIVSTKVC